MLLRRAANVPGASSARQSHQRAFLRNASFANTSMKRWRTHFGVHDGTMTSLRIMESRLAVASAAFVLAGSIALVYIYVNLEPSVKGQKGVRR